MERRDKPFDVSLALASRGLEQRATCLLREMRGQESNRRQRECALSDERQDLWKLSRLARGRDAAVRGRL
jgi:hypothetical protein